MPRPAHSRRAAPEASVEDLADELASVNLQGSSNSPQQVATARSPRTSGEADPSVNSPPPHSQSGSSRNRSTSTTTESTSAGSTSLDVVTIQCSGRTKAGERCKRVITCPPLFPFAPKPAQRRFCFQHTTIEEKSSGFDSHKAGAGWVKFEEWIPSYLSSKTQAALRIEMEKPASVADKSGYIYAYQIPDKDRPKYIKIKVGRTVKKRMKRLEEWAEQCRYDKIILRGWWPGTVEEGKTSTNGLVEGEMIAGERGPFCHRLERLIHIELADLTVNRQYLKPPFPMVADAADPGLSSTASGMRKPSTERCKCGVIHKEIFKFRSRSEWKNYKGRAMWERVVKPVIERWGLFVERYVDVVPDSDDSDSAESTDDSGW